LTGFSRSPSIGPVTDSPDLTPATRQEHAERKKRLARALRQNLYRRKQQARARGRRPTGPAKGPQNDNPPA
jgi:hypothetical protein